MKKIPNTSKYLKSLIAFDWWKVILASIAVSVLVYYAFYMKLSLKRYEQLQIFTTAEITDEKIINDLEEHLKDDGTLEVTIYTTDVESKYYEVQLDTNGFGNGDILILPASKVIDNERLVQNSLLFTDEFIYEMNQSSSSLEYLKYEEYTFAIKIYDKEDASYNENLHFNTWAAFDDTYYMMFAKKSPNLGKYGDKSKEEHSSAIKAAHYLLK